MKPLLRTILLGFLVLYSVLLVAWVGELHRDTFGRTIGNRVLFVSPLLVVVLVVASRFLYKGEFDKAASLGLLVACGVFVFLAWFSHPSSVYNRAWDRYNDLDLALTRYDRDSRLGDATDDPIRRKRLVRERAARKMELDAVMLRQRGDPTYFRSTFHTIEFSIVAGVMLVLAFLSWRIAILGKKQAYSGEDGPGN